MGIDDEYTAVSGGITERIGEIAIKNGYDVIFCYCPMKPKLQCEHIIIPEIKLALISVKSDHCTNIECDRVIHARRFLYEGIKEHMSYLRFNRKLVRELTDESVKALQDAKATHDKLEQIYIQAMDFKRLDEYCKDFCEYIFCDM